MTFPSKDNIGSELQPKSIAKDIQRIVYYEQNIGAWRTAFHAVETAFKVDLDKLGLIDFPEVQENKTLQVSRFVRLTETMCECAKDAADAHERIAQAARTVEGALNNHLKAIDRMLHRDGHHRPEEAEKLVAEFWAKDDAKTFESVFPGADRQEADKAEAS